MSYQYEGCCSCGETIFSIVLSTPINNYAPRACDCNFCTSRGIAYLSDPLGKSEINSHQPLVKLKQGSNQAHFFGCSSCDSIVAVGYLFNAGFRGAVNATLFNDNNRLQPAVIASPKLLNADEKVERWKKLWMTITL